MEILVFQDRSTFAPLDGCAIFEVPDQWSTEEIEEYLRGEDAKPVQTLTAGDVQIGGVGRSTTDQPLILLTPEERAQRLLDGREGWQACVRDTGGGIVVCEVCRVGDEDAPYAWVSDSGDETRPYLVCIYLPSQWEEPRASECVAEAYLESHVFAALTNAATDPNQDG